MSPAWLIENNTEDGGSDDDSTVGEDGVGDGDE